MTATLPRAVTTIILRGAFNPSIFQPAWFGRQGLISDGDADAADISIIHAQIAAFETSSLRIQVTQDLFEITSARQPIDELVRDVALGTFSILKHTPVSAVGINRSEHFTARSEKVYNELGHRLVPKEFWTFMTSPGTQNLTIRGIREDDYTGYIDVRFEPSVVVQPNGISVSVNDHIQAGTLDEAQSAAFAVGVIENAWQNAAERFQTIVETFRTAADG